MTEAAKAPRSHSYPVGDCTITVVDDGFRNIPVTDGYCLNASAADMNAALEARGLKAGVLHNPFQPIVITANGKQVLFDTGNGEPAFNESKGERGNLPGSLNSAGLSREAIDIVVISHCHGDHVNGLVTADGKPAFPRAEIKVPSVEWKFWMDDGEMSRAPAGRMTDLFKNNRRVFDALGRKVTPYDWDKEVVPGVTAVGTPGHSIGHTSFIAASGGKSVFVLSDVCINNPPLFVRHPGWHTINDQDPHQAEATRRRVLAMLAKDRMLVQAFHFPWPGVGHIDPDGDGYRFVPLSLA
jgi:glyoxylase-like metal-dependent hydrolase (beta-lactamase superfamily II)